MTTIDQVRTFLTSPDDEVAAESLDSDEATLWVDWREEDDVIVSLAQDHLLDGDTISAQWDDADPDALGLTITYNGVDTDVPYPEPHADRDTTLITLARVLSPGYAVRWFAGSLGSDTLGFVILPSKDWETLEGEFGAEKVAHHFIPVTEGIRMFALSFDEVFALIEERSGRGPQSRRLP